MKSLYDIKRKLSQNQMAWRYLFNCKPALSHLFGKTQLSEEARRVLVEMNRFGIATTTSAALLQDNEIYRELCVETECLQKQAASNIQIARNHAADTRAIGQKTFLYFLLGEKPTVAPQSVFARFALQNQILGIANAYMGMYTQLRYYNVWHTLASNGPARESQLWHRDRDDYLTCKVFLYLNEVDEGAGPFTYAKGTHPKGNNHREPPCVVEGGVKRSNDAQMAAVAPEHTWLRATGHPGTIIFADTRGYHKGGEARTSDRIMYTCMFLSSASEVREMMTPQKNVKLPSDPAAALALARYA